MGDGAENAFSDMYQNAFVHGIITSLPADAADVNSDGTVSMADVLALYQYFRGKTLSLAPEG